MRWLAGALAAAALLTGCDIATALLGGRDLRCASHANCAPGTLCVDQRCRAGTSCSRNRDCGAGQLCDPVQRVCMGGTDGSAPDADALDAGDLDTGDLDTGNFDRRATDAAPDRGTADMALPDAVHADRIADAAAADQPGVDVRHLDQTSLEGSFPDGAPADSAPSADAAAEAGAGDAAPGDSAGPPDGAACRADAGTAGGVAIAHRAKGTLTVDGNLDEWTGACFVPLQRPDDWVTDPLFVGVPPLDETAYRASFAWLWDTQALWLAVVVTDDIHFNDRTGSDIWRGDCVQAGFDLGRNGGSPYDTSDDFEYGWALLGTGPAGHLWFSPAGFAGRSASAAVVRADNTTVYEILVRAGDLGQSALSSGVLANISLLVAESDGSGRAGFLEWATGIGLMPKNPGGFFPLLLAP